MIMNLIIILLFISQNKLVDFKCTQNIPALNIFLTGRETAILFFLSR